MPPRAELFSALRSLTQNVSQHVPSPITRRSASTVAQKKRKHHDPYAIAQAKARKAANMARQDVLRTQRANALGDPVRGITTPFLESFDTALPSSETSSLPSGLATIRDASPDDPQFLNHFVTATDLKQQIADSLISSTPVFGPSHLQDPAEVEDANRRHKEEHENAVIALQRITSMENASAEDRLRTNIQRCINKFGRHNTDAVLAPKPSVKPRGVESIATEEGAESMMMPEQEAKAQTLASRPRAGPDTGSSEVQIAILTAKIRSLANFLETRGKKDKVNKRNLRLLVHRRQKLLAYMRKKERGGERWQHLVQTLGLTDGTWKGEISL